MRGEVLRLRESEYALAPGIAIFLTVMAFNLLVDALQDASNPIER